LSDDKETTPIALNVSLKNPSSDPDWIMKAVAISQYEASLVNQEVKACFISMVVTGNPDIEMLDNDDDDALDAALNVSPVVEPVPDPALSSNARIIHNPVVIFIMG
jgi:hypothetical protein